MKSFGIKKLKVKEKKEKEKSFLSVYRVSYANSEVPEKDKEYGIDYGSPVGNQKEWLKYAKSKNYKGVIFVDKTTKFKFVE